MSLNIRDLKGIGEKSEQLFHKLNVYDTTDLLKLYPRAYDVYEDLVYISDMTEEKVYAFSGVVASSCEINIRSRYKIVSVILADDNGNRIKATWFNMPFIKNQLKRGYRFIFRGKVAFKGNLVFIEQPTIYTYEEYMKKHNSMQPIYPLTAGLTNNLVIKIVRQCLDEANNLKDYMPEYILNDCELIGLKEAYESIHFPTDFENLKNARKRLVFDEFLSFSLKIRCRKNANILAKNDIVIQKTTQTARILANLDYKLTTSQERTYSEIVGDMASGKVMNRLVQGDVGSGKTIVAILSMVDAVFCGYQTAIMAPTEVLAAQHYESFSKIIKENNLNISCVLLTGSLSASVKRKSKEAIKDGSADIIIGTHAVITEDVEFNKLGLVVTDEQHRFGVLQRERLQKKGLNPHTLVMSATPIPRSLAVILYGDLDISVIDEKPANRLPIKNCVVDSSYRPNAYRFIKKELEKGHQTYIICAMANEGELENVENVVDYSKKLSEEFQGIRVEYLHGKMKSAQKNQIMSDFEKGDIKILVSTTVVEVGINVPNATVMMVENSERFGLSALHQLRGRVGRGNAQSYCIFISDSKNKETKERLNILNESNDGFYVAEQDLKLRGPGDILGTRQSGELGFDLGDIYIDAATLKLAADMAERIINDDPKLQKKEHLLLADKIKDSDYNLTI